MKKQTTNKMRILLLTIFLGACTSIPGSIPGSGSGGQKGTSFAGFEHRSPEKAHIYIYRPKKIFWGLIYPNISIDGEPAGELRNGTYIVAEVPPGEHTIVVHRNDHWALADASKIIRLKAEQQAFIKIEANLENIFQVILASASAGLFAAQTGVFILNEEDYEGAASSSIESTNEDSPIEIFSKLLLSNKYHLEQSSKGTE